MEHFHEFRAPTASALTSVSGIGLLLLKAGMKGILLLEIL